MNGVAAAGGADGRLAAALRRHLAAADAEASPGTELGRVVPFGVQVGRVAREAGAVLGVEDLAATADRMRHHLWGLGPLEPLLADPEVSDVLVNAGGRVYVERGGRLEECATRLPGERDVRELACRLAGLAGRRLDDASPWVDARLPGGLRLHAVLPPLSPAGTHLSLRVLRAGGWSLGALTARGAVSPPAAALLARLIATRANFLVSGGTGAGKTTLLAALLGQAAATERIVLVEDVSELAPEHPHVVRLEARPPNVEGRGGVGLDVLVRQAMRMRPDRLVVGECRGAEVRDLLAALNTGHAGGCGTVHANDPHGVPARLEALGALAGLDRRAVALQVAAGLHAVVHVERRAGRRAVSSIAALGAGHDRVEVLPVLGAQTGDVDVGGPGWRLLASRLGWS
ncbi:MAG: TadA family conjugal transfer-associated ATPase [Kineosporiaceae bacterium]